MVRLTVAKNTLHDRQSKKALCNYDSNVGALTSFYAQEHSNNILHPKIPLTRCLALDATLLVVAPNA